MYSCECLTEEIITMTVRCEECSPFFGECYPAAEGVCGPDCSPSGGCKPDCGPWDVGCGPRDDF